MLIALEEWLKNIIPVSGLLAVMSMACMLQVKSAASVSARLSEKFGKLWIAAEVILFVPVGQRLIFVILWKPDLVLFF